MTTSEIRHERKVFREDNDRKHETEKDRDSLDDKSDVRHHRIFCLIPEVGKESREVFVGVILLLLGLGGMYAKIAQNTSDIEKLSNAMEGGKAVSEATKVMLAGGTKQVS